MGKIFDDLEVTGEAKFSDTGFTLKNQADPTKQLKFNLDGVVSGQSITLYTFDSGAPVTQTEKPIITNENELGFVFFTSGVANSVQVDAINNPTSFRLDPASPDPEISIDNTGLISYTGNATTFNGDILVYASNIHGEGESATLRLNIGVGLQGSPQVVLNAIDLPEQDGDLLSLWANTGALGGGPEEGATNKQPTVRENIFKPGVKAVKFDGINKLLRAGVSVIPSTNVVFPSGGQDGELYLAFKIDGNISSPENLISFYEAGWDEIASYNNLFLGVCLCGNHNADGTINSTFVADNISITNGPQNFTNENYNFPVTISAGNVFVLRLFWNSGGMNYQIGKNGTPTNIGTTFNPMLTGFTNPSWGLGVQPQPNSFYYSGFIGAVVVYNSNLTQQQIDDNMDYLESIYK